MKPFVCPVFMRRVCVRTNGGLTPGVHGECQSLGRQGARPSANKNQIGAVRPTQRIERNQDGAGDYNNGGEEEHGGLRHRDAPDLRQLLFLN
jgi:hypothetical protein